MKAITSIEQVTPGWLTDILRREGVLDQGRVEAIRLSEQLRCVS